MIEMKDKILLIFEDTKNLKELKKSLISNDYLVSLCEIDLQKIQKSIKSVEPDVLVFYYKKVDSEIIEIVRTIQVTSPITIAVFSDDSDDYLISEAVTYGVTAFVVDGIENHRIKPIIEAAKARFKKCQVLKKQLYIAESKFKGGSVIDRAKDILIRNKQITEPEAYEILSNMAKSSNIGIEDLSKNLITTSELLAKSY